MCVRIFAYCVHAKSAGISIKTSHEHLLLHYPAVPLKVAKFQVAKNKRIDRRFIYISDSLLSLTLPASDFHPSHRRGLRVARSTVPGNAKTSSCGASYDTILHAFCMSKIPT